MAKVVIDLTDTGLSTISDGTNIGDVTFDWCKKTSDNSDVNTSGATITERGDGIYILDVIVTENTDFKIYVTSDSNKYAVGTLINFTGDELNKSIDRNAYLIESQRGAHTWQGNYFYVDPVNGDTHANGARGGRYDPYSSVQDCHDNAVTDSNHDVIFLVAGAAVSITTLNEAITISKRYTFIRGPGRDFLITRPDAGNTITVTADGVELSGFQLNTAASGTGAGVKGSSADFIKIQKCWVNDTYGPAINLENCSNGAIIENVLQGSGVSGQGHGIVVNSSGAESSNYNFVEGNIILDVQGDGIRITGNNILDTQVSHNTIRDCIGFGVNILSGVEYTYVGDNRLGGNISGPINDSGNNTNKINNEQWARPEDVETIVDTATFLPDSYNILQGVYTSGNLDSIKTIDLDRLIIQESNLDTDGIELIVEFNNDPEYTPDYIKVTGYYAGAGIHNISFYVYNYLSLAWEDTGIRMNNNSEDQTYIFDEVNSNHQDSTGTMQIRLLHNGSPINVHTFNLNAVSVSSLKAISTLTAEDIADAVFLTQKYVNYGGAIWIDTNNGQSGNLVGVNGLPSNPVDNIDDAYTLAQSVGVRTFNISGGSSITLVSALTYWYFSGHGSVDVNGKDISYSRIDGCRMSGDFAGSASVDLHHSHISDVTNLGNMDLHGCQFSGDIGLQTGSMTITMIQCSNAVAGTATPILNLNNTSGQDKFINIRLYSGGLEVQNMGVEEVMSFDCPVGELVVNVNCTAGLIVARGNMDITDNSLGAVTISRNAVVNVSDVVDGVWNAVLTSANYNINRSAGKRIRQLASQIIIEGFALGPGANGNQIELNANASSVDGAYDPALVLIIEGTGAGQSRLILEYDGAAKIATVDRGWKVEPDTDSEYVIFANPGREHVNEGLARGGTINTITLNKLASDDDDSYKGQVVFIRSGLGEDQARHILNYDGTTKVAIIVGEWSHIPDTTSAYVMLPTAHFSVVDVAAQLLANGLAAETSVQSVHTDLKRALGLMHENIFIDNPVYDDSGNMIEARIRIYSDSFSVGTENNVIGTYEVSTDAIGAGKFNNWKQIKV